VLCHCRALELGLQRRKEGVTFGLRTERGRH
jgi:hypothetical protein